MERLPQKSARLRIGQPYLLGVAIGPEELNVKVVGRTVLLELLVVAWDERHLGRGRVTGLDFEVVGDPVHQRAAPDPAAPTLPVYFTLILCVAGGAAAVLSLTTTKNVVRIIPPGGRTADPDAAEAPADTRGREPPRPSTCPPRPSAMSRLPRPPGVQPHRVG